MPLGAPIEAYMGCTDQEQLKWQFLKDLSEGDIIIGEIVNWRRSQYELKFICMDGGQARYIKGITIFCQVVQVFTQNVTQKLQMFSLHFRIFILYYFRKMKFWKKVTISDVF